MKDKLESIRVYYTRALEALRAKDYKRAKKLLYELLDEELYDLSLDILYNRNLEFTDKALKALIEKVDSLLTDEEKEETLLEDNFGGQI